MKTGIIDVGGGMRGIYGAGIMDRLMDKGIQFDCYIGVSAGAANVVSYMAEQQGRNYKFYTDYAFRSEYMGMKNYIQTGNYINLDYIYSELSNHDKEDPLNYSEVQRKFDQGKRIVVIATDVETGKPVYFSNEDMGQDNYDVIKASSCVPLVNNPYEINGKKYFDGGLSDSVPVEKAFEMGCDKVVLILTKPRDYYRETDTDKKLSSLIEIRYPNVAKALSIRGDLYNFCLDKAKDMEKEGKVLILAPDDIGGMKTLTRKKEDMDMLYWKGVEDALQVLPFLGK
ncbi:MAG: patatin family protein [Firmicutes bacterium]|nr:patatin family protein [Bacillota bacterium]